MHAISSYRGNSSPRNIHTHTHTHTYTQTNKQMHTRAPVANTQTGPITIHCAAKLSAQCNK